MTDSTPHDEEILFRLHFDDSELLEDAFSSLADNEEVISCLIEPEPRHLFFVATRSVGTCLLEEIYQRGALRWCTQHSVRAFH